MFPEIIRAIKKVPCVLVWQAKNLCIFYKKSFIANVSLIDSIRDFSIFIRSSLSNSFSKISQYTTLELSLRELFPGVTGHKIHGLTRPYFGQLLIHKPTIECDHQCFSQWPSNILQNKMLHSKPQQKCIVL